IVRSLPGGRFPSSLLSFLSLSPLIYPSTSLLIHLGSTFFPPVSLPPIGRFYPAMLHPLRDQNPAPGAMQLYPTAEPIHQTSERWMETCERCERCSRSRKRHHSQRNNRREFVRPPLNRHSSSSSEEDAEKTLTLEQPDENAYARAPEHATGNSAFTAVWDGPAEEYVKLHAAVAATAAVWNDPAVEYARASEAAAAEAAAWNARAEEYARIRAAAAAAEAAWDDPAVEVDLDMSFDDEDDVKPIGDKIPEGYERVSYSVRDEPMHPKLRDLFRRYSKNLR
ncbi:hypothetical protein PMAYCL1PPCAC_15689, partial [Pristionchus mayeri]